MPTTSCNCNVVFSDGSVRALHRTQTATPAAIAQRLRRLGSQTRTVGWGSQRPPLQALLSGLQNQGLPIGAVTVQPAADPLPVLMVIADQQDFVHSPGPAMLFLLADDNPATPLLLPAVQCVREAARRTTSGDAAVDWVLVQRPPGPGPRLATEQWSFNFEKIR